MAKDEQKTAKDDFRLNELVYRPHFAGCTQTLLQHTWSSLRQLALTSMPIVSLTWHLFLGCCKTLACFTMFCLVWKVSGLLDICDRYPSHPWFLKVKVWEDEKRNVFSWQNQPPFAAAKNVVSSNCIHEYQVHTSILYDITWYYMISYDILWYYMYSVSAKMLNASQVAALCFGLRPARCVIPTGTAPKSGKRRSWRWSKVKSATKTKIPEDLEDPDALSFLKKMVENNGKKTWNNRSELSIITISNGETIW